MRISLGVAPSDSVREIEAGRADYALDGVPTSEHAKLTARYGERSRAARDRRQQYFVNAAPEFFYIALNTSRAPFSDASLRKAANYAIDRHELIRLIEPLFVAEPTDQYLPPVLDGFRDTAIYPSTADPAAARRLVGNRRVKAVMYACAFVCVPLAQTVKRRLQAVGIDVEIREFSFDQLRTRLGKSSEPFDLTVEVSHSDTTDPARYLRPMFDGRTILKTHNGNFSHFDDPTYNRALAAAAKLSGPRRSEAYARLDTELARNAAPIVAVAIPMHQDFFSARIGCQVYNPIYGMSLAALCLRRS